VEEEVSKELIVDKKEIIEPAVQKEGTEEKDKAVSENAETVEVRVELVTEPGAEPKSVSSTLSKSEGMTSTSEEPILYEVATTVHCIALIRVFLLSGHPSTPTMWIGNSAGHLTAYQLTVPSDENRLTEDVKCILAKEVHLKHGAPVLSITAVDREARRVSTSVEQQDMAVPPQDAGAAGGHRLVVCSQEQIKIFSLPGLKPQHKVKLVTHTDNAKICTFALANFVSKSDSTCAENAAICLTNNGLVHIYSLPNLKRQLDAQVTGKDDKVAINSCIFSAQGTGYFIHSASELQQFSLAARQTGRPLCGVELKEGMRPTPPPSPAVEGEPAPMEADPSAAGAETITAVEGETGKTVAAVDANQSLDESALQSSALNESALASADVTTDSVHTSS